MSVFLIATIEVKASGFAAFANALGEIVPIVEGAGWKLASAYVLRTGKLSTVIDVWELSDFNHMNIGMGAIAQSPKFPEIQAVLQETIISETLSFADKLVYPGLEGR
jgi:hypothetical protein